MRKLLLWIVFVGIYGALASVSPAADRPVLTVMTHDSFAASQEIVDLSMRHGVQTRDSQSRGCRGRPQPGDPVAESNPLADVFYGVDNTYHEPGPGGRHFRAPSLPAAGPASRPNSGSTRKTACCP